MPTYEDQLRYSMHAYPSLHPTEWHALASMLFVIGNGMKWKNGELCRDYIEYSEDLDWEIALIRARHIQRAERDCDKQATSTYPRDHFAEELELALSPVEAQWSAELRYRKLACRKDRLGWKAARDCWRPMRGGNVAVVAYPCGSNYGAINNIPDGVSWSWWKALEKCRSYIHSRHIQFRTPAEREHALMRLDTALGPLRSELTP